MTRVMVVDDEPQIRLLLRAYLERDGVEVVEAADGETALEVAAQPPAGWRRVLRSVGAVRQGRRRQRLPCRG